MVGRGAARLGVGPYGQLREDSFPDQVRDKFEGKVV
jgi:hypothetical protein